MSANRKLPNEAADYGLLAPELAQGISRVNSVKVDRHSRGELAFAATGAGAPERPDISTDRGLHYRAILAVLLGCGLRRSEVAALTFAHVQRRDGRWCIVDLAGKHGCRALRSYTRPRSTGLRQVRMIRPVNLHTKSLVRNRLQEGCS